jgi:hypothetical protein
LIKKCIGANNKRLRSQLDQGRERRVEVAFGACVQYMKLQAEGASSRLHNSRLSFGIGIARIAEQGHDARCRDQLVQQFQPLRSDVDVQQSDAREVSSRSVQAGDKSGYDWIGRGAKDDWYGRGRSLGHWRRRGVCYDDAHLSANQIGCQGRQALVAAFCPAIFNPYVTALDVAGFAQAFAEGGCDLSILPRRSTVEKSNHWHRWLLRPRRERPRCRAGEQRYERAPPHVEHAASLPTIRGGLAIMHQQMRPVRPISRAVSLPRGTGKSLASCGDHLNHSESF